MTTLSNDGFNHRRTLYESELGRDCEYTKLIPQKCTLRNDMPTNSYNSMVYGRTITPFREVNIVPFEWARDYEFLNRVDNMKYGDKISKEEFSNRACQIIKDILLTMWDTNAYHVFMHSSGYDSRLISIILTKIRDEYGDDFIGDIIFIEASGEGERFRQVMEYEAWQPYQYIVFNEGHPPIGYYDEVFEFTNAYKRLNGYSGYPMNHYDSMLDWLYKNKIIDKNRLIQGLSGYGSNETIYALTTGQGLLWYFKTYYYHTISHFLRYNWLFPYLHLDWLEFYMQYGKECADIAISQKCGVSKVILDTLFPEVQKIEKIWLNDTITQGYRKISKQRGIEVYDEYRNSWYGKNIKPGIKFNENIDYNEWWLNWSIASLCEYLVNNNYEIGVER